MFNVYFNKSNINIKYLIFLLYLCSAILIKHHRKYTQSFRYTKTKTGKLLTTSRFYALCYTMNSKSSQAYR
jgi:hypothetical protein